MNRPRSTPPVSRLLSFVLTAVLSASIAHATPGDVVISQIYGGGGTTYANDFIELHNRGTVAVDVTGWSVQYSSATGSNWTGTILSGSIPAGGYYLVREGFGGAAAPLPTPNALGSVQMDATAGKVALVNSTAALFGTCPSSATIVDLVGYDATASCYETAPMAALSTMTAGLRNNSGCTDTDNNAADFVASAPNPRNSGTPIYRCPLTLTYVAGSHGDITGTKVQTVPYAGSGTEVVAVGETGYHFDNWDDGHPTANRTDTNVLDNITAIASFAINEYTLQYTPGAGGTITGTSTQTVQHGGNGTEVVAVANTGYHFVKWSDDNTSESRTDLNVTGDLSVTAEFAINEYTLQYVPGAGGTITGTLTQTVQHGGNGSEVVAVPNTGYHFLKWSDDNTSANRTDQNVQANLSVTAEFAIDVYALTVNVAPPGKGTVTLLPDQATYTHGTEVQLTADDVPDDLDGYHFDHWSGAVNSGANPVTVTMNSSLTITAHFVSNNVGGQIVISQFFGGGGDGVGGLKNDYVELYNRGNGPVSVADWSIQAASATGTDWSMTKIAGIVPRGKYLLVKLHAGGGGSTELPLPDVIGTTDLGATEGKIALVSNQNLLSDACPSGVSIIDLVGYGGAGCFEGSPTATLASTSASFRGNGGCDETDNNLADFASNAPLPRNSLAPENQCQVWLGVETAPTKLSLAMPGGNPVRGSAHFSIGLPQEAFVRATVSDVQGRRIASIVNDHLPAGRHELRWNGSSDAGPVRSGLYYLTLQTMGQRLVRSFVLMR